MTDERHNLPKGTGKLPEFLERPPFDQKTAARLLATFDSGLQFADLAPWAEQLRGAVAEIDRLTADRDGWRRKAEVALKLFGETQAEVARMTAKWDAAQPVVEAAEAWRDTIDSDWDVALDPGFELKTAVDAYRASKAAS